MLQLLNNGRSVTQKLNAKKPNGLSVRKSKLHGKGCFATLTFREGHRIGEYAGQRITRKEAMLRMKASAGKHISELDADLYIDGSVNGNQTQFINHSCDPNADVLVVGPALLIVAIREIAAGEEITVDYLNSFDLDQSICKCRATACRQTAA